MTDKAKSEKMRRLGALGHAANVRKYGPEFQKRVRRIARPRSAEDLAIIARLVGDGE